MMGAVRSHFAWNERLKAYVLTDTPPAPGQKTFDASLLAFDEDVLERGEEPRKRCVKRTRATDKMNHYLSYLYWDLAWPPTKDTVPDLENTKLKTLDYPIIIAARDANHKIQLSISTSAEWSPRPLSYHKHTWTRDTHLSDFQELLPFSAGGMKRFEKPLSLASHKEEHNKIQPAIPIYVIGRLMTREADVARRHNWDLSEGWDPSTLVVAVDLRPDAEGKKAVWIIHDYDFYVVFHGFHGQWDDKKTMRVIGYTTSRLRNIWPALPAEKPLGQETTFDSAQLTGSVQDPRTGFVEDMGQRLGDTAGIRDWEILEVSQKEMHERGLW